MKIDDDFAQEAEPITPAAHRVDPTLLGRAILTFALAAMLIVALHWALTVTNANAQQVSTSIASLQNNIDRPGSEAAAGKELQETSNASGGPVLEPADNTTLRSGNK